VTPKTTLTTGKGTSSVDKPVKLTLSSTSCNSRPTEVCMELARTARAPSLGMESKKETSMKLSKR